MAFRRLGDLPGKGVQSGCSASAPGRQTEVGIMVGRGIVKGGMIKLEQPLPLPDGQPVTVAVQPVEEEPVRGSPALVLRAMHGSPRLKPGDIEEFNRVLRESRLSVEPRGVFDEVEHG
jgi:hypothetical protein